MNSFVKIPFYMIKIQIRYLVNKCMRGQASVEYLGTYAWAFLSLVVALGALSYFGILDSSNFVNERCNSGSQIECLDVFLDEDGTVYVQLRNNYAKEIVLESIEVTNLPSPSPETLDLRIAAGGSATAVYPASGSDLFADGNKEEVEYTIWYRRFPGGTSHFIEGTALAQVQDSTLVGSLGYCGNGKIDGAEECDPITISLGGYVGSSQCDDYECLSDCTCDRALCGNGILDEAEKGSGRCEVNLPNACPGIQICSDACYCIPP